MENPVKQPSQQNMSNAAPKDQESLEEFLWSPKVHEELGESLAFYFIRTAFSKLALEDYERILKESRLPAMSYLLFGQFDASGKAGFSRVRHGGLGGQIE